MLVLIQYALGVSLAVLYFCWMASLLRWCTNGSARVRAAVLTAGLALGSAVAADFLPRGDHANDFAGFYAGAQLVGTPGLYDRATLLRAELAAGARIFLPVLRLPVYLEAWKPVTLLPPDTARLLWAVLSTAALVAWIWVWPDVSRKARWVATAAFFPSYFVLRLGQDTPLVLLLGALGTLLLARRKHVAGGFVISLCAIKFSLGLALPVVLIACRRWRALLAAAAGVAAQVLLSWAIQGKDWPGQFLAAARRPVADVADEMPNLRGLFTWMPFGGVAEILGALAVAYLVYRCGRVTALPVAMAVSMAAGQFLSHHGFSYDAIVMLPLIAIGLDRPELRTYALALLGPLCFVPPRICLLIVLAVASDVVIIGAGVAMMLHLAKAAPNWLRNALVNSSMTPGRVQVGGGTSAD